MSKELYHKKSGSGASESALLHKRLFVIKETLLFYIKMAEDKRLELLTPESKSGVLPLN